MKRDVISIAHKGLEAIPPRSDLTVSQLYSLFTFACPKGIKAGMPVREIEDALYTFGTMLMGFGFMIGKQNK